MTHTAGNVQGKSVRLLVIAVAVATAVWAAFVIPKLIIANANATGWRNPPFDSVVTSDFRQSREAHLTRDIAVAVASRSGTAPLSSLFSDAPGAFRWPTHPSRFDRSASDQVRGCYAEYRRVGFPCRSHACSTIDLFGMQAGVGFINGELTEAFHGPTGAGDYEVSLSAIGGNAAVYLVLIFAAARSVQFVCTRVAASRDRSPASG